MSLVPNCAINIKKENPTPHQSKKRVVRFVSKPFPCFQFKMEGLAVGAWGDRGAIFHNFQLLLQLKSLRCVCQMFGLGIGDKMLLGLF